MRWAIWSYNLATSQRSDELAEANYESRQLTMSTLNETATHRPHYSPRWDVFISYAGEDRDNAARPLADALEATGLNVWFDHRSLKVGDSLFERINEGLSLCNYGVVILSESFLAKDWPQRELSALMTRDTLGRPVVLPVWHQVTLERLRDRLPLLADRVAVSTDRGIDYVVSELLRAMNIPFSGNDVTGLWIGDSGRLRITPQGQFFAGDYDWNGYEWAGHFLAERFDDKLHLTWQWDLGHEQGIGYLVLQTTVQKGKVPYSAHHEYMPAPAYWHDTLRRLSGGWILGMHRRLDEIDDKQFSPWSFTSVTANRDATFRRQLAD